MHVVGKASVELTRYDMNAKRKICVGPAKLLTSLFVLQKRLCRATELPGKRARASGLLSRVTFAARAIHSSCRNSWIEVGYDVKWVEIWLFFFLVFFSLVRNNNGGYNLASVGVVGFAFDVPAAGWRLMYERRKKKTIGWRCAVHVFFACWFGDNISGID